MHGIPNQMEAAFALAWMVGVSFVGIRILVDPRGFLTFAAGVADGASRFGELLTRAIGWRNRPFDSLEFQFENASKSARLLGLLVTMLGELLTRAIWWRDRPFNSPEFQFEGACKSARLVGLLVAMLGLLGTFAQLARLSD